MSETQLGIKKNCSQPVFCQFVIVLDQKIGYVQQNAQKDPTNQK